MTDVYCEYCKTYWNNEGTDNSKCPICANRYHCQQCGKEMTIADFLVNPVCKECCKKNQKNVTRK